jgi:hypothetical protein
VKRLEDDPEYMARLTRFNSRAKQVIQLDELAQFTEEQFNYVVDRIEREAKMKLRISREDLLKSKIVEPGWYPSEVIKVDEATSKAGDSMNWNVTVRLLAPDAFAGVTIIRTFNEKAPGFAVNFLKACGANIGEDGGEFDMSASMGRKLMSYIKTDIYNGQQKNKAEDFRPIE